MLEVIQFENGRYGLRNTMTGIVVDRDFRTIWGAMRYIQKSHKRLGKAIHRLASS